MDPGENLSSHLQFTLPEITKYFWKRFKINSEVVARFFKTEFDPNEYNFTENYFPIYRCYENGQMNALEEFIEAVICYNSTKIDIAKVQVEILQFTIGLLKIRNAELLKLEKEFGRNKR